MTNGRWQFVFFSGGRQLYTQSWTIEPITQGMLEDATKRGADRVELVNPDRTKKTIWQKEYKRGWDKSVVEITQEERDAESYFGAHVSNVHADWSDRANVL